MLENRPIAQKTLYGTGAFAFVFAAAMLGTAFMITGGIGHGEDSAPADAPAYQIAASDAWSNLAPDASAATPSRAAVVPAALTTPTTGDNPARDVGAIVNVSAPSADDAVLSGANDAPQTGGPAPIPDDKPAKSDSF